MSSFIEVEIEPGNLTKTGQRYHVWCNGERILESVKYPEFDAARKLLELGADVDDTIVTRHRGESMICLFGRIGYMAAHTCTEGESTSVRIVPWVPYSGPGGETDVT